MNSPSTIYLLIFPILSTGEGKILGIGSRIIPMDKGTMDTFGSGGQIETETPKRTGYRGVRRLRQRQILRRERLHRVLNIIGALPEHYARNIDFIDRKGQFVKGKEVKLNYKEILTGEFEFIFKENFLEMAEEFKKAGHTGRIPRDWTIYYLRKKALKDRISLQELAWVILNFNQKRGYYQLRGEEEEENEGKKVRKEFVTAKFLNIQDSGENDRFGNKKLYAEIATDIGDFKPRFLKKELPDWIDTERDVVLSIDIDKQGGDKINEEGNISCRISIPAEDDYHLLKAKAERAIKNAEKTVGVYIYDEILKNPTQKIRGRLVRTIERHFYKDELINILEKQKEFHQQLQDESLLEQCILELYPNNYGQQNILKQQDFIHLFVEDIIFYQRPLKSQKSLINECQFEARPLWDKNGNLRKDESGKQITKHLKAIHKSHPLYQEFRLWQFIGNLRIYEREKLLNDKIMPDVDVTHEFISDEEKKVELFDFFNDKSSIKQKSFLAYFKDGNGNKLSEEKFRWNYVEDKEYPLNETRALFISTLSKDKEFDWKQFLTIENEIKLWHILYSISDKKELERVFDNPDFKLNITLKLRQEFKKIKPFKNDHGTLSEKAIKKVLPLMRLGRYWNYDAINSSTKSRIQKIQSGEFDEKIKDQVREKTISLQSDNDFKGLPFWLASYIVYNRHSESAANTKWTNPEEIDDFLKDFKQHSLRNPIVEQVITETLRIVRDIWQYYGNGDGDFFDEIHIELGRDMKNPAYKRSKLTEQLNKNQETNERIRNILRELKTDNIDGVIPDSARQQEKLKIFEEDILNQYSVKDLDKEVIDGVNIGNVSRAAEPTPKEIQKYKLWLEQKYRSPYTGDVIPLSKLFTTDYEIDHIIPQAKYFDNSFGNKVICETEVNKTKGNQTAFEFIHKNPGRKVDLGKGKSVELFSVNNYQDFISKNYKSGTKKHKMLLSEEVPEQFISRQLNDTRYISKFVKGLLSNIVRDKEEQEATSKNIVPVTGSITKALKIEWGLEDKWNEIILPRFKRLNKLTNTNDFTYFSDKHNTEIPDVPPELKKGFNKKRIDHRHHAMDALTVALATRNHVSYLGNEHAKSDNKRYDLRNKLRKVEETQINGNPIKISKEFYLPWQNFPVEAKEALEKIVVSFKQNIRVINKATNRYQVRKNDKVEIKKQKGVNWAIRKPMHDPMPYGKVNMWFDVLEIFDEQKKLNLIIDKKIKEKAEEMVNGRSFTEVKKEFKKYTKEYNKFFMENENLKKKLINTNKIDENTNKIDENIIKMKGLENYVILNDANFAVEKTHFRIKTQKYGKRQPIENIFSGKNYSETIKSIYKIGDHKLQLDLIEHLNSYCRNDMTEFAFSQEGIENFNKNRNKPVFNIRVVESGSKRFPLGESKKYVESTEGNNLFFAIYWDSEKEERKYVSIPLIEVIEHQKWRASLEKKERVVTPLIPINNTNGKLLFYLSPNDLVYVPTDQEMEMPPSVSFKTLTTEQNKRIMSVNDFSGVTCYFSPNTLSKAIKAKEIDTSYDDKTARLNGVSIKERCWKLYVDRLGNIKMIINHFGQSMVIR